MPTILADSFTAALARLNGEEQKQAKLTAFDLQTEPDRPGLQFHRIDNSKDRRFWSLRVSRDIRIIVHKDGDSVMLVYVGHHDDAYGWAERRRIETHPATGAVQIVEVRERVEAIERRPQQAALDLGEPILVPLAPRPARPAQPLFAALGRDDLLSVGVPEDWLEDVGRADDDTFLALAGHLPAEAAEALLDYAATGLLKRPQPIQPGADPFEHPDTMRRFRVLENREELEAALDFPWDKWSVFLHPAQRELTRRVFSGPARVVGSAGTGKTVVALHRATRLAERDPDARVLLTTFSDPLANALASKLKVLTGGNGGLRERISVASFLGIAEELYQLAFGRKPHLVPGDILRSLVSKARQAAGIGDLSEQFVLSEWSNVVDAWQIDSVEGYAAVPRMGRRARLGARQRERLWPVFEAVRAELRARHLMTPASLFAELSRHYAAQSRKPFAGIVVDEAQDLGVAELRFLAAMAPSGDNTLFFAGDLGQRIFQQPFSWKGLGVDVRGRSSTLRVNYRTSHQIRMAADRLLPEKVRDVDGLEDDRAGTISVFNGPVPSLVVAPDEEAETSAVADFVRAAMADGIEAGGIGLFVRSASELGRARAAAARAGVGTSELSGRVDGEGDRVTIGTMHFAKGLEFRAVAVMACDEGVLPALARIEDVADEMELDEVYSTERQLLYVAATRARDRLLISGVAPGSEFLMDFKQALERGAGKDR